MPSENLQGAFLMMAAMALFTVSDAVMKLLGSELPMFQTLLWRGLVICAVLFVLGWRVGAFAEPLAPRDRWLVALRALADTVATWFFLQALYHMPLANLTAVMQALPLTVTLAAALFLREPVGWKRMSAILIGFLGILLIVRPGTEGFGLPSVYALITVVLVTLRDLATRRMTRTVPSFRVAFYSMAGVTVLGALGAVTETVRVPTAWEIGLMSATAACLVAASMMTVMAVRRGELGFVTPFRYTGLVWALVLGLLVFGDWPSGLTMFGAGLVVATGLFTLYREQRVKAAARRDIP